jgi:hypothetical protein
MLCFVKQMIFLLAIGGSTALSAHSHKPGGVNPNQTSTISPIHTKHNLPFRVRLKLSDVQLPAGLHSFVSASYDGKWLFLAGQTNGMHALPDFADDEKKVRALKENRAVYVVDMAKKTVVSRSLTDKNSGLTQKQIDSLSVTAPQFYQRGKNLFITGGYGVDSETGNFLTFDTLTAIDVKGLMHWVTNPHKGETAAQHMSQQSNPLFQVTGGYMTQIGKGPTLLIFGHNFTGFYLDPTLNGDYTRQVRRFHIELKKRIARNYFMQESKAFDLQVDFEPTLVVNPTTMSAFIEKAKKLSCIMKPSSPLEPNPNYRRRDLNVCPQIRLKNGKLSKELVAFSGVFTPGNEELPGMWTVPVEITANGRSSMADPTKKSTFKQGMNNYICPTIGLFSEKSNDMYTVFFGGISFGYFRNGNFKTDQDLPFINDVTAIKIDKSGRYKQYLMDTVYPAIKSAKSHTKNRLRFGTSAIVMMKKYLPKYTNDVVKFDKLAPKPRVVGYIVGGIQSTVKDTEQLSDSSASPYIFEIIVEPKR